MHVVQLTANDSDLILEWVLNLLEELGEESDDLGELQKEKVLTEWRKLNDRFFVFAAKDDEENIQGLITLAESFAIYANGNYGIINEMMVAPAARSQGVGAALIQKAISFGRERDWSRIDVTAPESERWSKTQRFYEQQGFTFAGPKLKLQL